MATTVSISMMTLQHSYSGGKEPAPIYTVPAVAAENMSASGAAATSTVTGIRRGVFRIASWGNVAVKVTPAGVATVAASSTVFDVLLSAGQVVDLGADAGDTLSVIEFTPAT